MENSKLVKWFKDMFDKNSSVSSKRFGGITLMIWGMIMGTYYILKIQYGGVESSTTVSIIEFSIVSAVGLLAGGTLAENLGNRMSKSKEKNDGEME